MKKLESTRWYVGGGRDGFPPESLAYTIHREYRLVRQVADMVLDLAGCPDEMDQRVVQELKKLGYSYRARIENSAAVHTEITTPTHLVQITGSGDEPGKWVEATVFERQPPLVAPDPSHPDQPGPDLD